MDNILKKDHEVLYSGSSLKLGESHWYMLRAKSLLQKVCIRPDFKPGTIYRSNEITTQLGKEVFGHEIHWWVYQKENNHDELLLKTQIALNSLQKLKEDADSLKKTFTAESYQKLINNLKEFTESHREQIDIFSEYVLWLAKKDPYAPILLFSFEGWGSTTRINERTLEICNTSIDENREIVKICTDISLGLSDHYKPVKSRVEQEMAADIYDTMDPENRYTITLDKKILNIRIAHRVLDEFEIYIENIRDSLKNIIDEIEKFNGEPLPVVRTLNFGNRIKEIIRFCIVQINYPLRPISGSFGFEPSEERLLKEKIISAIKIAQDNSVDLICFPELCFKKEWVEELLPFSTNMVIVCGSYYEDSYNMCPLIIHGHIVVPPYKKHTPSPAEQGIVLGQGMKPGKIVYIYKTDIGTFSTLVCIDYAHLSHHIISQVKSDIDFIVNPCYDDNISRFQKQCNFDCENHNLTILQVNRADSPDGKYGKSGIISKEHKTIIDSFTSGHFREDPDDEKYLLVKLRNEEMVIADLNLAIKAPPVDLPVSYIGRLKICKLYEYTNSNWVSKIHSLK
jgi:predicted amidohydrolase